MRIPALAVALLVAGCMPMPPEAVSPTHAETLSRPQIKAPSPPVYEPAGREEFVFAERPESLRKYGYTLCVRRHYQTDCSKRLAYEKYVGMKGYFASDAPSLKSAVYGDLYQVNLENGETYYFAQRKSEDRYRSVSGIIPRAAHDELKAFHPEPLVPGSRIVVTAVHQYGERRGYTLSNGDTIADDRLEAVRAFAGKFGQRAPRVSELLVGLTLRHDEIENRYFISPKNDHRDSYIQLYLGYAESKPWLRFRVRYYSSDWLFVKSFLVAADDYRWQSPAYRFQRDHSSGSIWEWIDLPATDTEINVAKKVAASGATTIRFQGDKYYADRKIGDEQKQAIKDILELHSLLSANR